MNGLAPLFTDDLVSLAQQTDAKPGPAAHTSTDHVQIALFENLQIKATSWKHDHSQWKQRNILRGIELHRGGHLFVYASRAALV